MLTRFLKSTSTFKSRSFNNWLLARDKIGNFNDTQNELKESIEAFAKLEIAPRAAETDKNNNFPNQLWKKMGDMGILGVTAETKYGGLGMGYTEHCIIMEELSRYSGSIALSYGAHSNLCVNQLTKNGNDEQKAKYLPKVF